MNARTAQRLPDAISARPESGFTPVRNSMLRDPGISLKAKGLLCILLSNKTWAWTSYRENLIMLSKDGATSVDSGLKELEAAGYLMRLVYRDKVTKQRRGSFWAYTDVPWKFDLGEHLRLLDEMGLEVLIASRGYSEDCLKRANDCIASGGNGKGEPEKPYLDFPNMGAQRLKRLNSKKTKEDVSLQSYDSKETKRTSVPTISSNGNGPEYDEGFSTIWSIYPRKVSKKAAYRAYRARLAAGHSYASLLQAVRNYSSHCQESDTPQRYIKHLSTFLGPDEHFLDWINGPPEVEQNDAKPTTSAREIFRQAVEDSGLADQFLKECAGILESRCPQLQLTKDSALAAAIIRLYKDLKAAQGEHLSPRMYALYPRLGPMSLVTEYLETVPAEALDSWQTSRVFQLDSGWMKRFLSRVAAEENIHPIFGE